MMSGRSDHFAAGVGGRFTTSDFGMTVHPHTQGDYTSPLTMISPGKKIGEMRIGPHTELHTDQEFLDPKVIDKYRDSGHKNRVKDGTVSVVKDETGRAWVHNGHHRIAAARAEGHSITAEIRATPGISKLADRRSELSALDKLYTDHYGGRSAREQT